MRPIRFLRRLGAADRRIAESASRIGRTFRRQGEDRTHAEDKSCPVRCTERQFYERGGGIGFLEVSYNDCKPARVLSDHDIQEVCL